MSIGEKIKKIDNKIDQNKAQYNLHRQTAKISALSSRNVRKYESITEKRCFAPKERIARKSYCIEKI